MRNSDRQVRNKVFVAFFLVLTSAWGCAQSTPDKPKTPDAPQVSGRSIEDLNFVGGDAAMPPFSDSIVDVNSTYRLGLLEKGIALRLISQAQYAQNMLQAPVSANQQVYVGEHPFESAMAHLILTSDLRQFHLQHAQFYASGVANWVSWDPAGPKTIQIWDVLFYKMFGKDLVEMKAGYISNNLEFVGMLVGGSTANGVQGVYAVLPYEVGLSYFPLATPSFNLRIKGPKDIYIKTGAQRSVDAAGGPASVARNHTGFRFDPNGDKLLLVEEVGYQRAASATERETWFRAGYLHNSTLYTNMANGKRESGNHVAFVLLDVQLRKPDPGQPSHGLYLGGSAMTAASKFNPYDRYLEARLYQMGTFRKRPGDVVSVVSTYTGHSRYLTDTLVAQNKTAWRHGASVTGSYNIHFAPGNYLSLGLSYIHGPAITPRVDDTLTVAAGYTVFF